MIGSSPFLPLCESAKLGLLPLVISENTQRIWLVVFPQAKLTWPGSEAAFGFWQAVAISACTVGTLDGQDGLPPDSTIARIAASAATPHTAARMMRVRVQPDWVTLLRP